MIYLKYFLVKISDELHFWWEQKELDVKVVDSNVENIVFRQIAYLLPIQTSHPVVLVNFFYIFN